MSAKACGVKPNLSRPGFAVKLGRERIRNVVSLARVAVSSLPLM